MTNVKNITIYDQRGNDNDDGDHITVIMKRRREPSVEDENQVFNRVLKFMKYSESVIYYYIEYIADLDEENSDDDSFICDISSFELAKKLGRTQEIKYIVNSWLDD